MLVDILIVILKIVIVLGAILTLSALLTWVERKQSAVIQDRIGANRADIFGFRIIGLFHIIADSVKMLTKEDFIPAHANKVIHTISPFIALFPAIVAFAVIPFGDYIKIGDKIINLQIANLNIGILYVFAILSLGVYGVTLAGWSSNNKYALLGALRASAQMLSYEVTMGLTIIGVLMIYQSIQLNEIARAQGELLFGFLPKWGIFLQPLGFILFITAVIAETKRIPFDLPEGESEIVAGYFIEYSGMKFGMFLMAEFVEIIVASAVITTLFFGGWQVPYLFPDGFHLPGNILIGVPHPIVAILQIMSFTFKVCFFCWFLLQIRWTLPRFRYDQVMKLGWKMLLPLSLLNIFITGLIMLGIGEI